MQQERGRRAAPPFAGVDLRRPRGYALKAAEEEEPPAAAAAEAEEGGDPCPRCESRDTKFCYYNNYNTSQPRHFCKSCRRYWTKGGSLRNVPVGGGTRRSSSAAGGASASPPASKNPKRSSKASKRRRVARDPEPAPTIDADVASTNASTATTDADVAPTNATTVADAAPPTEAAAAATSTVTVTVTVAADDPPTAPPPPVDGDSTDKPAAPGLGLAVADGAGGKAPPEASPFEWPSGCDLGSYWATGVFADTDPALFDADPALFLNLP